MAGLPEVDRATIDARKITHYLLSSDHPAGRAKRIFFSRFGSASVIETVETQFGRKYVLEGPLPAPDGRRPNLRSIWFVIEGETIPRLVTAYGLRGVKR